MELKHCSPPKFVIPVILARSEMAQRQPLLYLTKFVLLHLPLLIYVQIFNGIIYRLSILLSLVTYMVFYFWKVQRVEAGHNHKLQIEADTSTVGYDQHTLVPRRKNTGISESTRRLMAAGHISVKPGNTNMYR